MKPQGYNEKIQRMGNYDKYNSKEEKKRKCVYVWNLEIKRELRDISTKCNVWSLIKKIY